RRLATRGLDALVVVVHRHCERPLRVVLPDDVLLEEIADLVRFRQLVELHLARLGKLFLDDLVAEFDALIADIHTRSCDELFHLFLALATERTLEQVSTVADPCHGRCLVPSGVPPSVHLIFRFPSATDRITPY